MWKISALGLVLLASCGSANADTPPSATRAESTVISARDLERQRTKDEKIPSALKGAGSDLSKPHMLEHHFECANRSQADQIAEWARRAGSMTGGYFERP